MSRQKMIAPLFTWRAAIVGPLSDLPSTTRLVLLVMGLHMNEVGESCFPSVATLMAETGLSKQAVIMHLALAMERGWISKGRHGFADQRFNRSEYFASVPFKEDGQRGTQKTAKTVNVVPEKTAKTVNVVPEDGQRGTEDGQRGTNCIYRSTSMSTPRVLKEKTVAQSRSKTFPNRPKNFPKPDGVDEQTWDDFKRLRNAKKAPVTVTAVNSIKREAAKAGISVEAAIQICIERNWQGFRADWLKNLVSAKPEKFNGSAATRAIRENATVFNPFGDSKGLM